jgi:N-hydroxyarylamine O-acetyltransferase
MNHKAYLQRVGISPDIQLPPTEATLAFLQRQHLLHVPFENLDIQCRIPMALYPDAFFEKIVTRGRGGYCYECNGLFCELLRALGFQVQMISCRVVQRRNIGPEFDHLALLVTINGQEWQADVGFGDFSEAPILVTSASKETIASDGAYCILPYGSHDGRQYLCAARWNHTKQDFLPAYLFTMQARQLSDFAGMHHYHQTDTKSHFTRSLICSLLTRQGRISLINNRLIIRSGPEKTERLLYGNVELNKALAQYFGMRDTFQIHAFATT